MNRKFLGTSILVLVSLIIRSHAQEKISLEQVVALALDKNFDIQLSRNTATAAETDNNYSSGVFLPVITGSGSKIWNSNDQNQKQIDSKTGHDTTRIANGVKSNNLSGSIQLTWTLFDGTKMFATRNRLAEIAIQGELNLKNQMVNSVAAIVNNYYNVVQQKQQLRATTEQMSLSEERVKLADKKLSVGTGAKPELLQAKLDLNAQRTLVLAQETSIAQLKAQLNVLVGMQLPEVYDVSDSIVIDLNLNLADIQNNIENTNFGLQSVQRNITIARYALHERQAERYPVLNFVSNYTYSSTNNTVSINPSAPLYSLNKGYNYGFAVSMPFLNGFTNRRLRRQAEITLDRQEVFYDQQKAIVNVGIRNAYVNYENAKKALQIEEENIVLAKENISISLESFRRGVTTYIELRTAQQSLADAYYTLITARYNAKLAETELLRLNGGLLK